MLLLCFVLSVGLPLLSDSPLCCQMLAPMLTSFTYTADNPERQLEHVISLTRLTVLKLSGSLKTPLDATMCTHWLCQLPSLHRLYLSHPSHLTSDIFQMQHLQSPLDPQCDLSGCTQLTSLHLALVEDEDDVLECLILPSGHDVSLKHLRLERLKAKGRIRLGRIENLAAATQLTKFEIIDCFPDSFVQEAWPPCLPMLEVLNMTGSKYGPPPQILQYKRLLNLSFDPQPSRYALTSIPDWFSQMTQLQRVAYKSCSFSEFPAPLLALSQLVSLCLSNRVLGERMTLPRAILSVAAWPHLSCLNLRSFWGKKGLSVDSHVMLLQLLEALGTKQSVLQI